MGSFIRLGSLVALAVLTAAPLAAQSTKAASLPLVEVSPYVGYLAASNLADGPLGTSISAGSGGLYGAQVRIPLMSSVSVIGNFGYSAGKLRAGIPIVGGISLGDAKTYLFDGGLQLSAPELARGSRSLTPFVQAGVGGVRRDLSVAGITNRSTNLAWNIGAGGDLEVLPGLGLRILVKDYIGKFDVREATGFDVESRTMHDWGFSLGVNLSF
jgi:hypothetical protein